MRAVHVVGGGPAGVMAAFAAMREGASVRIFEKFAFPRHKVCGEFLSPAILPLLRRAGCEAGFLQLRPAVLSAMRLHFGTRVIRYLLADGQVQAHDAVLIEPNVIQAEHVRDRSGKGSVQEGAAALRVFSTFGPALMNPHGNMNRRILFTNRMQTADQLLLTAEHLGV